MTNRWFVCGLSHSVFMSHAGDLFAAYLILFSCHKQVICLWLASFCLHVTNRWFVCGLPPSVFMSQTGDLFVAYLILSSYYKQVICLWLVSQCLHVINRWFVLFEWNKTHTSPLLMSLHFMLISTFGHYWLSLACHSFILGLAPLFLPYLSVLAIAKFYVSPDCKHKYLGIALSRQLPQYEILCLSSLDIFIAY